MKTTGVLCAIGAFTMAFACSSSSSHGSGGSGSDGGGDASGGVDATIDVIDNQSNCVKPGTANNSQGVGGYCNPNGGQCDKAGPGGTPTLCTGDTTSLVDAWFCTVPCPANCGAGATCTATTMGSICVPTACISYLGDAALVEGGEPDGETADGATKDGASSDGAADGAPHDGSASDAPADASPMGDAAPTDGAPAD